MSAPPYPKIENRFRRREDHTLNLEQPRREEFRLIDRWMVTEKIDGTNIRISLEPEKQIYHRRGFPSSVREMHDGERGFVGGMVEADGNVGLYARAKTPDKGQWEFNVVNTDPELLSALIRATGTGTVTVQHLPENEAQQVTYKWSVNRFNDMKAIAEQCSRYSQKMQPLLQAEGATEFIMPVSWVVRFGGRTDKAQMPDFIQQYLEATFRLEDMKRLWQCRRNCEKCGGSGVVDDRTFYGVDAHITVPPKGTCPNLEPYPITIYGEAYGARIQKGGGDYRKGGDISLRIFDILVGERAWLGWDNIVSVADTLHIETVPLLDLALDWGSIIQIVRNGFKSVVAEEEGIPRLAEGIVARTDPYLFDGQGRRIVWKLKTKDF